VAFYEGGLAYDVARSLPIPELLILDKAARRIAEARKKAMTGALRR
jgi:hypothetical protein